MLVARRWGSGCCGLRLLRPASELGEIEARLEAVGEAAGDLRRREGLRRSMDGVLDLERLLGRVALDSAGPREVMALAETLGCLPGVVAAVRMFEAARWRELGESVDALEDLHEMIVRTIAEEPPVSLGDGGAIRAGVDAELDELRELSRSGRQALAAIEERERARTGIGSLKVRFNTVFGYYLEVTKANAKAVPADYERKQTLVNAERFTTPELKEYETKILTAQERSGEIERRIFAELRRQLLEAAGRMRETARKVAEIDMLGCFAHLAALRGWVRPQVERVGRAGVCAGAASGGGAADGGVGWREVCAELGSSGCGCGAGGVVDYGAEYGGQEYVSAAGGAAGGDGADAGALFRRSGCGWGWWIGFIRGLGRATMWRGGGRRSWWR